MKRNLLLLFLVLSSSLNTVYSQNYDLIVTTNGDYIACRIDSITHTEIYFQVKVDYEWINMYLKKSEISDFQRQVINKKSVDFKPGTSFIESSTLQKFSMSDIRKNAIIIELESLLFIGDVAINYERNLISRDNNSLLINLRCGYGRYYMFGLQGGERGSVFKLSINELKGNGKSYFETNFGLGLCYLNYCDYSYSDCPEWKIWPIVNIGYRYQSGIIFRCYVGTLGIGISLGVRF